MDNLDQNMYIFWESKALARKFIWLDLASFEVWNLQTRARRFNIEDSSSKIQHQRIEIEDSRSKIQVRGFKLKFKIIKFLIQCFALDPGINNSYCFTGQVCV